MSSTVKKSHVLLVVLMVMITAGGFYFHVQRELDIVFFTDTVDTIRLLEGKAMERIAAKDIEGCEEYVVAIEQYYPGDMRVGSEALVEVQEAIREDAVNRIRKLMGRVAERENNNER